MHTPGIGAAAVLLLSGATLPAVAEPRTLYEKLAFSRTIVIGTCVEQGRFAKIDVAEVLKGDVAPPQILIAYRLANWDRTSPEEEKIEFLVGERSILLIEPDATEDGRVRESGRFVLARGAEGKITVPEEGSQALLAAVRRMIEIQGITDQNAQWDAHRALLEEANPLLVETGIEEVLKFRLGTQAMLPTLDRFLTHPRDGYRMGAVRILVQLLEGARRRGEKIPDLDSIGADLMAVLGGDPVPEIRARAVQALCLTPRSDLADTLRQAARADASQIVRYEAQRALRDLKPASVSGSP